MDVCFDLVGDFAIVLLAAGGLFLSIFGFLASCFTAGGFVDSPSESEQLTVSNSLTVRKNPEASVIVLVTSFLFLFLPPPPPPLLTVASGVGGMTSSSSSSDMAGLARRGEGGGGETLLSLSGSSSCSDSLESLNTLILFL
uniref:Uncharacterized protein n=1 Tax=Cacopsylla melanoneura TaxID=428564 RepID=A0A8D8QYR4_9HEMI